MRLGTGALWRLGALCVAGVLLAGCGAKPDAGDDKAADVTVKVKVVAVERRAFRDEVSAPGQWRSAGDIVIPAPFPAAIEALGPRVGDRVASGQALGMLVTRESRAAERGAELLVREAHDDAARAEAERALALAKRDLVRVPLLAPRAGVVTRRAAEPGAEVAEGADLLALMPDDALVFEARVPAADARRVHAGQRATIVEEGAAPRAAVVQRLLPEASSADQATLVWLASARGDHAPALDRFGTATLELGAPHTALAVPAVAVAEDDLDGTTRVAVIDAKGEATWVALQLGASADGWREVRAGALALGARVIVEGQHGLPEHARVAIQP